jgi:hypothetical protein
MKLIDYGFSGSGIIVEAIDYGAEQKINSTRVSRLSATPGMLLNRS